jgi:methionyl-tRNA synthetase
MTTYITVAIPYVNADPHLGYAFELVEADLAARARRSLGDVRFLGGTDEYSLKNVLAAEAAGQPTEQFVAERAARFVELAGRLDISFDDFIRTSTDPRHVPAVVRLWRACVASGDLYRRDYEGAYCVGCEEFYAPSELDDGNCPEHGTPAHIVAETNWFFRLSRYQQRLLELIESGHLVIEPEPYRNEVLAFVRAGLEDISVSRSAGRAHGWGVPVPDDTSQVIYVWFDALTNYISALGYGIGSDEYERWWRAADDRIHVVGKGITRFHAVYWPAFLLSAGEPLPTRVHVHPYLTVEGRKLSKSSGNYVTPVEVVERFGEDALRWWLTAEPAAAADTDVTIERIVARSNTDLANGIGNAVRRVTTLVDRHLPDGPLPGCEPLPSARELPWRVAAALAGFDRRGAVSLITDAVDALNRDIEATEPWQLAKAPDRAGELATLLGTYHATVVEIVEAVRPIVPALSARADAHLRRDDHRPVVQPRRDVDE